jgi:transposase
MLEVADKDIKTEVLDHHGLVAATCREIKLQEEINKRIGSKDPRRVVQPGLAVVAMIINGLGFTNRRLYLTPQFFNSKPLQLLLGEEVQAKDLNDHALGKALDEIADYGSTKLFGELAFAIAEREGLLEGMKETRLDSTSFALHGRYDSEEDIEAIEVCKGYSKDHRPDLNQVLLSLVVGTKANLPMWMESNSGNASDKKSFHETVRNMRAFQKQLKANDCHWIADSALYTPEKLLKHKDLYWTTRVVETISACKTLLEQEDFLWTKLEEGYAYSEIGSNYGGIKQRWIIVQSEQAYKRELKTLEKKVAKEAEAASKACWHLGNESFSCEKDAAAALKKLGKKYHFHRLQGSFEKIIKYPSRGRPKKEVLGEEVGVRVGCTITKDEEEIARESRRKGRFIIATNNLSEEELKPEDIFQSYRNQQDVERGFGFLKDPWFMVSSFFLKSRLRIEALMMIMTLCLLIYNLTQYRLRDALVKSGETLPNQKGKAYQRPTLKWIFQMMEGIGIVHIFDQAISKWRSIITNLDSIRQKIICLIGDTACEIYGLQKNFAGM